MANPHLVLEDVSYVLPDGRTLFSALNESFDQRPTGLVGRNGVGKTLLARILAGQLEPGGGRCRRSGSVHYLAQQVAVPAATTVAGLAGVAPTLEALARIAAGSGAPADFDAVDRRWDMAQRFSLALVEHGLGQLDPAMPAAVLSGGEAMRVALIGALLSDADFLILDEPSNHLDQPARRALIEQLRRWPRGLLVVSHDRQLLAAMSRIVELSASGLRSYGGNYAFYARCQSEARQNAIDHLARCKHERQRQAAALREQGERQARRQARGKRQGQTANQAKILLDRQKERSESSAGRWRLQQAAQRDELERHVRDAAAQLAPALPIVLRALPVKAVASRRVVEVEGLVLPFVAAPTRRLSLALGGEQRVGVVGPNGCGKSTLLKVLAGQLMPLAGRCRVTPGAVHLDQRLAGLDPDTSVLAQLLAANRELGESEARTRLAQLGLTAGLATLPSGKLSGGERLKAALACVLYALPPPPLLLLDEPANHLDLPSLQALESLLVGYRGALLVVAHDEALLRGLQLTHRLVADEAGWRLCGEADG